LLLPVIIMLLVIVLGYIISFAVRKIYAQDFRNVDTDDIISIDFLNKREVNNRVFITGLPYSGRGESLAKYINVLKRGKIEFLIIDLRKITGAENQQEIEDEKNKVIFLMNFEYNINNHKVLKGKLRILEKVLFNREKQVIVSSEIHPNQVIRFYEMMISKIRPLEFQTEFRAEYNEYQHNLRMWQQIFRGFIKVYHPLGLYRVKFKGRYQPKIRKTIINELKYGNYLNKLEPLIYEYYKKIKGSNTKFGETNLTREDVVLRIESLAETYYQSIWNSFTKSEKYLIFDLAKDRFVNVKNDSAIKNLLNKGVFIYKDNLQLMNKSFNNFVLNVVDSDQEIKMEKELKKKGSWGTIQLVLILAVISITVFIVLGQKSFMNEFNSLLGALGAVVGLLLRFGGIFRSSSNVKV